jgi:hypothetical protein
MKKLTLREILKLGYGKCAGPKDLRPFPGKYPTRLHCTITYADRPPFHYEGKPSVPAVVVILKLYRKRDWKTFRTIEFDRKQWVAKLDYQKDARFKPIEFPHATPGPSFVFYHASGNPRIYLQDIEFAVTPWRWGGEVYRFKVLNIGYKTYSQVRVERPAIAYNPPAAALNYFANAVAGLGNLPRVHFDAPLIGYDPPRIDRDQPQ